MIEERDTFATDAGSEGSRVAVLVLLALCRHAPISTSALAHELQIDVDLVGAAVNGLADRCRIRLAQRGGWEIGKPR